MDKTIIHVQHLRTVLSRTIASSSDKPCLSLLISQRIKIANNRGVNRIRKTDTIPLIYSHISDSDSLSMAETALGSTSILSFLEWVPLFSALASLLYLLHKGMCLPLLHPHSGHLLDAGETRSSFFFDEPFELIPQFNFPPQLGQKFAPFLTL